jgi:hypothetical protein
MRGKAATQEEKRIYRKERKVRKKRVWNCRGVLPYARVYGEEPTIDFTTKDTKSTKFKTNISETFVTFVRFVVRIGFVEWRGHQIKNRR